MKAIFAGMHFRTRVCLAVLILSGCLNKPDCIVTTTNLVKISFVDASNKARTTVIDSIRVSGVSQLLYLAKSTSSVDLPVQPGLTESVFNFYFETRSEQVKVQYSSQPQVISADCGAYTQFNELTVSESSFTSFSIISDQLSTNATVNLQLRIE